jgi:hypothetical protein
MGRPESNECFFGGLRVRRPKELIAVAARCDVTTICRKTRSIAEEETLETRVGRPIWRPLRGVPRADARKLWR